MPATVSFLVPLYNEATSVGPMLQSILQQKYGQDHLEVLIAMAPSDDGTEQEVENFIHNHPTFKVQVLPNPDRNTAVGRNLCLAHATGEFVINFSGHAIAEADLVPVLLSKIENLPPEVIGIGCRIHAAESQTVMGRAIATVLESPLGGSTWVDSSYHAQSDGPARSVAFTLYRRIPLEQLGGFDPNFWCGQDAELNLRLARAGYRLWFTPDTGVEHRKRNRLSEFVFQSWQYGGARAKLIRKYPDSTRLLFVLPTIFLFVLIFAGVIALSSPTGAWAMTATAMLFLVACSTCALFSGGSLPTVLMSPLLYALLYVAYGIGFVCGLIESPALQHNARS